MMNLMNVIVLDVHHPEDGRVNRHLKYMQSVGHVVARINVNRYYSSLNTGHFSKFGEFGYLLQVGDCSYSLLNRMMVLLMLVSPVMALRIYRLVNRELSGNAEGTVIHVHDYELLISAVFLRYLLPDRVVIVYDRHELYETTKIENRIIDKIPRVFEVLANSFLDGLIGVSDDHLVSLKGLFKRSAITIIPNYPEFSGYSLQDLQDKFPDPENPIVRMVYFGSLNVNLDRDIFLVLLVMKEVLRKNPSSIAHIGGLTEDPTLLSYIKEMEKEFPGRFYFLGYVPYDTVLNYTSLANLGFLCMKPEYWVRVSANKVYEYLQYGVIPIIKADIENPEKITECSLLFSKDEQNEVIISDVMDLVRERERMKVMMERSYELGREFTFDRVKGRYLELYSCFFSNFLSINCYIPNINLE